MIYCARQLFDEKVREHNTQIFVLFIDLRKAYDSIPRSPLWHMLEKYSIPPILLSIICSLHDGMKAEVTVDGNLTLDFEVCNGLRQGCVIAPSLFNLYFNLVISQWQKKCAVWIRNLDHHTQYNQETGVVPQSMPKRNLGHYI